MFPEPRSNRRHRKTGGLGSRCSRPRGRWVASSTGSSGGAIRMDTPNQVTDDAAEIKAIPCRTTASESIRIRTHLLRLMILCVLELDQAN